MLAVLDDSIAKSPEALKTPSSESVCALKNGFLASHFAALHPSSVSVSFGSTGFLSYSSERQNPLFPRLFAVADEIYCLFEGHFENVAALKQQYGLNKTGNEVSIIIEAYRTLRDRGPYPADKVVRDFRGKFAFIIYDHSSRCVFAATDEDGSLDFYWGTDREGRLILADDSNVICRACGKAFAPFPKGCFFTSSGGLRSYEHPLHEVKAVPRVDSSGNVCGPIFKVDVESKKEGGMPRVGSAANWSSDY